MILIISCSKKIPILENADDPLSNIQIDPRKYVSILYGKKSTNKLDTIWKWEEQNFLPNQKFQFLNSDGIIKICFDKTGLINNQEFEGTFSLEAEISGNNGTRKIEVNPYSEIGVERIPIIINSEPPSEIAKKLLNIINLLRDADEIYNNIKEYDQANLNLDSKFRFDSLFQSLKSQLIESDSDTLPVNLYRLYIEMVHKADRFFPLNRFYIPNLIPDQNEITKGQIINGLDKLKKSVDDLYEDYYLSNKISLKYIYENIGIVLEYLNSFEEAGDETKKAFLSLVNKDLIGYNNLKHNLVNIKNKIDSLNVDILVKNEILLNKVINENKELIMDGSLSLSKLSSFKGSQLYKIIRNYSLELGVLDSLYDRHDGIYGFIEDNRNTVAELVSKEAGKIIYKKLIYANIDLGKSGAQNGDVLNIYLTWIIASQPNSLSKSPRLPIGRYNLRETGWKLEVSDMFSIIKRIDESIVNQSSVSPTNFKGSGGAVLLWTYNKEDKGIKIKKKNTDLIKIKTKNKLMNFFEPSFGLNVSYLDFSTEKDVEIGTGLQLGLFSNKIFFGSGINLHLVSPKNQSPYYLYVGFSFARLSNLFKDTKNIYGAQ